MKELQLQDIPALKEGLRAKLQSRIDQIIEAHPPRTAAMLVALIDQYTETMEDITIAEMRLLYKRRQQNEAQREA